MTGQPMKSDGGIIVVSGSNGWIGDAVMRRFAGRFEDVVGFDREAPQPAPHDTSRERSSRPATSVPSRAAEVEVIGLGVMGDNLALKLADHGYSGDWAATISCRSLRPRLPVQDGTGRQFPLSRRLESEDAMQVQVNTDRNIEGREALATKVQAVVENALGRLRDQITRVEVHLSDENGQKRGQNDKRCMVEARLDGRRPVAVTHQAANLDEAVEGAAAKMARLIESTLGRGANSEAPRD